MKNTNSMQQGSLQKAKHRFAFMFLLTSILSLSLSYFVFGMNAGFETNKAGMSANVIAAGIQTTGPGSATGGGTLKNPLGTNGSLAGFLDKLLGVIIMLGAIVIVFSIILAGFKYVTAAGDMKKVEEAHKQLFWTAIGAAILLGARVISSVIKNTVQSLSA